MDAERRERIQSLFNAAREKPLSGRRRFLFEACGNDAALVSEVESLLADADDSEITRARGESTARPAPRSRPSTERPLTHLGHYRVLDKLGQGGMGEVFLAQDTKLNRKVALKTLPASLARDGERLARFSREARLLASLNHPNVGAIYSLEEDGPYHFLVLELVPGATLAERLSHGPMSLDTAAPIALQVVAALRAAHDRGVVHRDLKPGNVMVTPDGTVKVLDFGLAKALIEEDGPRPDPAEGVASPSPGRTQDGLRVGTPPYMSPEQVDGRSVDARTDIWAFGCLLFELLTGVRAFTAPTIPDIFRAILSEKPDWTTLPKDTPPAVVELLRGCLEKNVEERIGSLESLSALLDEATSATSRDVPTNLPSGLASFVGRTEDIAEIRRALVRDHARIITLSGPSGIGKTRLALEAAGRLRGLFSDGVWLVPLTDLADPASVVTAIADTLSLKPQPGQDPEGVLADYLEQKELLLVLDNFEHVLDAAPLVPRLLERAPGLSCIVTSQEELWVTGEHIIDLSPLSVPSADGLARLEQSESGRLFVDRAKSVRRGFELTADNAPDVAAICRSLDGLPLAIELAAARIREMPAKQIAKRLAEQVEVLTSRRRDVSPRHRSLRAAMDWSFGLLSPEEQDVLAHLTVFSGGFFVDAAHSLLQRFDVDSGLVNLSAKSFVIREEVLHETRYRMLRPIREYAREKLGEADSLNERHARYYLRIAEESDGILVGPEQETALARMGLEVDNFRQAMDHAHATKDGELLGALSASLSLYFRIKGFWSEAILRLTQAREQLKDSESLLLQARLLRKRGSHHVLKGEYDDAERDATESLQMARQLGEKQPIGESLLLLGVIAKRRGGFDEPRDRFAKALGIFRELGNKRAIAQVLQVLSDLAYQQGHIEESRRAATEGLKLFRDVGDRTGVAVMLNMLGALAGREGNFEQCGSLLQKSLDIHRELGDDLNVAQALNNLGCLAVDRGSYGHAKTLLSESCDIRRELGNKRGMAESLHNLGLVAKREARYDESRNLFNQSLYIQRELGGRAGIANVLRELGDLDREVGAHEAAREQIIQSIQITRESGDHHGLAESLHYLGQVADAEGDTPRGVLLTKASLRVSESIGETESGEIELARESLRALRAKLGDEASDRVEAELETRGLEKVVDQTLSGDYEDTRADRESKSEKES